MNYGATLCVEVNLPNGKNGLVIAKTCSKKISEETLSFYNKHFSKLIIADIEINEVVGGSSIECMFQPIAL